jgi:hypothetical protein
MPVDDGLTVAAPTPARVSTAGVVLAVDDAPLDLRAVDHATRNTATTSAAAPPYAKYLLRDTDF